MNDIKSIPVTTESTKLSEQLPFTSTWAMPQPICFWGNPSQFFAGPSSSRPYSDRFDFFPPQSDGMPFQDPQDSSQPYSNNNIQIKTSTVRFMERSQGQSVDPAEAAMSNAPISSLSQQPITMNQQPATRQSSTIFQQPIAGMPYFCAYMTIPNLGFPPGTSDRSSTDEAKNLSEQPLYGKDSITTWKEYPGK